MSDDFARRYLAACEGKVDPWMPGMAWEIPGVTKGRIGNGEFSSDMALPDFSDPLTAMAPLIKAREAMGKPHLTFRYVKYADGTSAWAAWEPGPEGGSWYATEPDLLTCAIAAIEAAQEKT